MRGMIATNMKPIETQLCPRVLLVDDSPFVRKTLCAMLRAWNIECVKAENGNSGFEQVISARPDLVITDLYMPECDGFELLSRIAELPDDPRPPVIVLSGSLHTHEARNRPELDLADYLLIKPIQPHCLYDVVSHILEI